MEGILKVEEFFFFKLKLEILYFRDFFFYE